jgi:hypothetical protein
MGAAARLESPLKSDTVFVLGLHPLLLVGGMRRRSLEDRYICSAREAQLLRSQLPRVTSRRRGNAGGGVRQYMRLGGLACAQAGGSGRAAHDHARAHRARLAGGGRGSRT